MAEHVDDRLYRATQYKVYFDEDTRTLTVNGVIMVQNGKFLPVFKDYLARKTVEVERAHEDALDRIGETWSTRSLDQMRQTSIYWLGPHLAYTKRFLEHLNAVAAKM